MHFDFDFEMCSPVPYIDYFGKLMGLSDNQDVILHSQSLAKWLRMNSEFMNQTADKVAAVALVWGYIEMEQVQDKSL